MNVDLVIFDCDGVLVDSETLSTEVLLSELARSGIAVTPDFVRDRCLGRSFPVVANAIRQAADAPLPEDFETRYRKRLMQRFEAELRVTAGLPQVLAGLAPPSCVATSSSPERVARTLDLTGLDAYFGDRVFTASEVRRGKPAPDLFLLAAARMRADPSRTLVIEDSGPGLAAGFAAGMQVAMYAGGSHLDGVDLSDWDDIPILRSWADFPADLLLAELSGPVH